MNTNGIYSEIYSFSENSQENFLPHSRGRRAPAGIYTNSVYCMRHYRAAIILYRYLPHTVPQCTVLPPPTRQACACRQIRELRLLYASLSRRDHTLQLFAAYRTAMHRSSLTHAAGVRLQAFTRTRFIVCVTIVPRSYFTDICRIPYRNAPFLPHPRGRRAPAGKYADSGCCMPYL